MTTKTRTAENGSIQVTPRGSQSDAEIQQAVFDELVWGSGVDATEVGVEVDAGVVTLTGTVASQEEKCAAARAANRALGVLDVANDIVVNKFLMGVPSYADLEMRIHETLARRANRAARRIRVAIKGHRVTLWGMVRSSEEQDAILETVRHAPGVREVKDELVCTLLPLGAAGPTPSGWRNR